MMMTSMIAAALSSAADADTSSGTEDGLATTHVVHAISVMAIANLAEATSGVEVKHYTDSNTSSA